MAAAAGQEPAWDEWAQYYDVMDADRRPFVDFYGGLVSEEVRSLLDLGCGTGSITVELADRIEQQHGGRDGIRVVGVDESAPMLEVARERRDWVDWRVGDIREPPADDRFDLIICTFSTFQVLLRDEDLATAFDSARKLLANGGVFAFDLYLPNLDYLQARHRDFLARETTDNQGRRLEIREDTSYDPDERILQIDWRLIEADGGDGKPLAEIHYDVRQYFPDDVERILDEAGFTIRERYGDLDRSPAPDSKKQVLVCSAS